MKKMNLSDLIKSVKEYGKSTYCVNRVCNISSSYSYIYNDNLLESPEKLKWLYEEKGLTKNTVKKALIGIDEKLNWQIPIYRYVTDAEATIIGQQELSPDFKIIDYVSYIPASLTMINKYSEKTVAIIIVNDYLEGYTLLQYLEENCIEDLFHIVVPSHGVNCLYNLMQNINFDKYEQYYLMLHGYGGEVQSNKIIADYPMFQCLRWLSDFRSFNEQYVESLKYSKDNLFNCI